MIRDEALADIAEIAGALYAIAYAVHQAVHEYEVPIDEAMAALGAIDFSRPTRDHDLTPKDTVFAGNLVDSASGRIAVGRSRVGGGRRRCSREDERRGNHRLTRPLPVPRSSPMEGAGTSGL